MLNLELKIKVYHKKLLKVNKKILPSPSLRETSFLGPLEMNEIWQYLYHKVLVLNFHTKASKLSLYDIMAIESRLSYFKTNSKSQF